MITFLVLLTLTLIAVIGIVVVILGGGTIAAILFGDLFVFILIVWLILKPKKKKDPENKIES